MGKHTVHRITTTIPKINLSWKIDVTSFFWACGPLFFSSKKYTFCANSKPKLMAAAKKPFTTVSMSMKAYSPGENSLVKSGSVIRWMLRERIPPKAYMTESLLICFVADFNFCFYSKKLKGRCGCSVV